MTDIEETGFEAYRATVRGVSAVREKRLAEALAEIDRLRAASEWRDISTAKDEGKPILGYQETPGDFENQWAVCWAISVDPLVWMGPGGLMPTKWQPLLAPPQRNEVTK